MALTRPAPGASLSPGRCRSNGFATVLPVSTADRRAVVGDDAAGLIDFVIAVFGAREVKDACTPSGLLIHGELGLGDSLLLLSDRQEGWVPRPGLLQIWGIRRSGDLRQRGEVRRDSSNVADALLWRRHARPHAGPLEEPVVDVPPSARQADPGASLGR